jgi:hypothetical protein
VDNEAVQNLALVIGIIVAFSLALTQAMGGLLTYLVEAIKATGKVAEGWAGVVAIFLGILIGGVLAAIADGLAEEPYGLGTMLMVGGFAGALMAAGSIKTFKAMGQVNTSAAFSEGLAAGERVAAANNPPAIMQSFEGPAPQDFGQGYAAGQAAARGFSAEEYWAGALQGEPAEAGFSAAEQWEFDPPAWAATVEELDKVDQLRDEELEAHEQGLLEEAESDSNEAEGRYPV